MQILPNCESTILLKLVKVYPLTKGGGILFKLSEILSEFTLQSWNNVCKKWLSVYMGKECKIKIKSKLKKKKGNFKIFYLWPWEFQKYQGKENA